MFFFPLDKKALFTHSGIKPFHFLTLRFVYSETFFLPRATALGKKTYLVYETVVSEKTVLYPRGEITLYKYFIIFYNIIKYYGFKRSTN